MQETLERTEEQEPGPAEPITTFPSSPPKPLLLDYLFAFGIGLWCLGAAVGLVVACSYGALVWWAIRTATGTPLALLSAALVARSLQRREG